jgi:hypothetical protein
MKRDKQVMFANNVYDLYKGTGYHFTANEALKKLQDHKIPFASFLDKKELSRILTIDSRFNRSDEKVRINQRLMYLYWVDDT